ncbi:hypothetical protein MTP04_18320 [Lysinibacillus sp. PLM2]|nr:hypothetical protein MTP04_18320 [Lysinibacillus sp. PLM2]
MKVDELTNINLINLLRYLVKHTNFITLLVDKAQNLSNSFSWYYDIVLPYSP